MKEDSLPHLPPSKESHPPSAERVALFQGILIGVTLVIWIIRIFDMYLAPLTGWPHLAAPGVDGWLWPPFYLLLGGNLVYRWQTMRRILSYTELSVARRRLLQRLGWVGIGTMCIGAVLLTGIVNLTSNLTAIALSLLTLMIIVIVFGVISVSRR